MFGILSSFFGRVAVPAMPTAIVQVQEDPDLQELTPQEIAECELAEALWPQKELALHLQARYGDGESAPGLDKGFAERLRLAQGREARPTPELTGEARRAELIRLRGLAEAPQVKQPHETSHEERLAEIIEQVASLKAAAPGDTPCTSKSSTSPPSEPSPPSSASPDSCSTVGSSSST